MIRITELKLPLSALPVDARRATDAPAETEADRLPVAHPLEALAQLSAQTLGIDREQIAQLQVFKRSFDARFDLVRRVPQRPAHTHIVWLAIHVCVYIAHPVRIRFVGVSELHAHVAKLCAHARVR